MITSKQLSFSRRLTFSATAALGLLAFSSVSAAVELAVFSAQVTKVQVYETANNSANVWISPQRQRPCRSQSDQQRCDV
jgi:hypothetical protein